MAQFVHKQSASPIRLRRQRLASFSLLPLALAITSVCAEDAQSTETNAQGARRVDPITVTARSAPILDVESAQIGGFAQSIANTPQSISVIGADLLSANAVKTLSSALKLDASLADNYNANGYIESLSVRGFALDQSNNFRRNGLATSNYAPLALENKERIEVLKGVAGLQAGVSAPGGLVNFVTKKPSREAFTQINFNADEYGTASAHVDANHRIGAAAIRINVAAEKLRTQFDGGDGTRSLTSGALSLPLASSTTFETEFEFHRKSQPSVPGLGLLDSDGDGVAETLPRVLTRLNLNNQSWSLPVQSHTTQVTSTLAHKFNERWHASVSLAHFASTLDDRIAFPDGCGNATNYVYPGLCANGDIDIYDFRSDNERRKLTSWEAKINGKFDTLNAQHQSQFTLSGRTGSTKMPPKSAYNYAGSSNIFSPRVVAENAALESVNTNADDRSTEAAFTLQSDWNAALKTFAGVRATRAERSSVRSDDSQRIAINQTVATRWFGITTHITPALITYAQWGQGVELENVPNRPSDFQNFGAALVGLKSNQLEVGAKWQHNPRLLATLAIFNIEKPFADDLQDANGLRTRVAGGKLARHRGAEVSATGRVNQELSIQASATYLDARYVRALDATLVNQRATNTPRFALSVFSDYKVAAISGLSVNGLLWLQQGKTATANGSVMLPTAWQIDLGASYRTRVASSLFTTRINIENITNRDYWREAPTTSWGGTYLFASKPRTFKLSASIEF
jgi:iron complex outermembrane recepter protein